MQTTLIGFTHDNGFRVFSFDRLGDNRERTRCTVRADLALTRTYGIQVQELPLLCRGLLERCEEGNEIRTLTFAEHDMKICADERVSIREAAARKRKPRRLPAGEDASNSGGEAAPVAIKSAPVFGSTFISTNFPSPGGSQL